MKFNEQLEALQEAVEDYLDKPGCNIPARNRAVARLRHALERSRTHDDDAVPPHVEDDPSFQGRRSEP